MPDDLPPGSHDEAILDLLHGVRVEPHASDLVETWTELGALRLDWARQVETIRALEATVRAGIERTTRLQGAIARLSKSLAEAHAAALPVPADDGDAAG